MAKNSDGQFLADPVPSTVPVFFPAAESHPGRGECTAMIPVNPLSPMREKRAASILTGRWSAFAIAFLVVGTVFVLSVVWEYGFEELVWGLFGLGGEVESTAHRIEYIATATLLTLAGVIVPTLVLHRIIGKMAAARRALRDSEQRFREFAEMASDWLWEVDKDQRYTWMSDNIEAATGIRSSWFLGKRRGELGGIELNPTVWAAHEEALRRHEPFRDLVLHRRGPYGERWIRSSGIPVFAADGSFAGYRGTATDVTAQIRAEHQARDSRDVLAEAVENLDEAVALWDGEGRLVFGNARFREANAKAIGATNPGITQEELLRLCVEAGVFPDAVGREAEWLTERLERRHHPGEAFEQRCVDGSWLLIHEHPLPGGGSVTIATDITAHKRVEEGLTAANTALERRVAERTAELEQSNATIRASEKRFQDFVAASVDWVWETDADLRFTYISPKIEEATGMPPEAHYGLTRQDILGPGYDRHALDEHLQALRNHEPFRDFIFQRIGAGGREPWLRASGIPLFDGDGRFIGYRGTGSDITPLVTAQQALRASEQQLRSILDNSPLAIMLKGRDGVYWQANRTYADGMGVPAEQLIGRHSSEVYPAETVARIERRDRIVVETRQPVHYEIHLPQSDGTWQDYAATKFPVLDDRGEVAGIGLIAHDITEQNRTMAQLLQSQKMEAVGQLTSGIAHDFNNLLGIVMGNAELLLDDPDSLAEHAAAIMRSAERGAALTRQLLVFSRNEPMAARDIAVAEELATLEKLLQRTLGEIYRIRCHADPGIWDCVADPGQLESAVVNLAINARDAMPGGGELTIDACNQVIEAGNAGIQAPGEYVLLSVSDTGRGIPPENLDRVFEPFFTTKEKGKGTGLGLSMVYGFARQSKGHVTIESVPDVGTTVRIFLPRARTLQLAGTEPYRDLGPRGHGETILVVEDQDDLRDLTVKNLESLGYTVHVARDGFEAETILRREGSLDLLLTDVVLPGGRLGPDIAELAVQWHPTLRTLYISGFTGEALHDDGRLSGDKALLRKPFRKPDLARAVRSALQDTGT
jgi:PAS domain S-box-containing protein